MDRLQANLFGEEPVGAIATKRVPRASAATPNPSCDIEYALLLQIVKEIELPQPKHPLQCVTYKMPLRHYQRMKQAAKTWNLTYSDLLRLIMLRMTIAIEQPSPELLEALEGHREQVRAKRAARFAKRKGHGSLAA